MEANKKVSKKISRVAGENGVNTNMIETPWPMAGFNLNNNLNITTVTESNICSIFPVLPSHVSSNYQL